jgi:DNA-binding transcriptional LysR family regulator
MFLTEFDKTQRLLKITLAGHTTAEEARSCLDSVRSVVADIQPGFRLLADLRGILSMPTTAAPYIGQLMESCAEKGVELVVRLLPAEPSKDIGFAIISHFHYGPDIPIVTCATMEEASSYLLE